MNTQNSHSKCLAATIIFAFCFFINVANAAQTTSDPHIALDHLELLLTPLTKSELEVEASAWRDLVKQKGTEISQKEILSRSDNKQQKEEIDENKVSQSEIEEHKEAREKQLDHLSDLREQNTALIERFRTVLDGYKTKGGDVEEYTKYADAVAGIRVEVTDTSATWAAIKGWIKSAEGGVKLGLQLLEFSIIMLVFWLLAIGFGRIVRSMTEKSVRMSGLLKTFLNKIVQRVVLFLGLMVALSTLGVEVGALLALVGGGAFIIGFALQDTLGNFAAGMMLLIYRPFDVGDIVEVGGVSGQVDNVSLVSTTIRTFDNKVVLVPNKNVWGQVITNATASEQRRVDLTFKMGYGDDVDLAKTLIDEVIEQHELVLAEPKPTVELHALGDSSIEFICRPWTATPDYWRVYWDITKQVKQAFTQAGMSAPFPQRNIHVQQVNDQDQAQLNKNRTHHSSTQLSTNESDRQKTKPLEPQDEDEEEPN